MSQLTPEMRAEREALKEKRLKKEALQNHKRQGRAARREQRGFYPVAPRSLLPGSKLPGSGIRVVGVTADASHELKAEWGVGR
jgi:hypothetical protein